jgi:hypothetical protein
MVFPFLKTCTFRGGITFTGRMVTRFRCTLGFNSSPRYAAILDALVRCKAAPSMNSLSADTATPVFFAIVGRHFPLLWIADLMVSDISSLMVSSIGFAM